MGEICTQIAGLGENSLLENRLILFTCAGIEIILWGCTDYLKILTRFQQADLRTGKGIFHEEMKRQEMGQGNRCEEEQWREWTKSSLSWTPLMRGSSL